MKKINLKLLKKLYACSEAVVAYEKYQPGEVLRDVVLKAMDLDHFDWANWLITRCMNKKKKVQYAIFAAELVLKRFEDKYPTDKLPRKAIDAAKNYLKYPCKKTKNAAAASAAAVAAANAATYADAAAAYADAAAAANAATYAADAAAYAASATATAAANYSNSNAAAASAAAAAANYSNSNAAAAVAAANAATYAAAGGAGAAYAVKTKIINYGLEILGE